MFLDTFAVFPRVAGIAIWLAGVQLPVLGAPPTWRGDLSDRLGDPDAPVGAVGGEPQRLLSEQQAIRLALEDHSFKRVLAGRAGIAESDVTGAGIRPNPELALERESAEGLGDPSETTFLLSQTFDTSGRRRLRRQSARASLEATRQENLADRLERALEVRRRFYRALHSQRRGAVLRAWRARIQATERIVSVRTEAGEASLYDLRRLRQEGALALTKADEAMADFSQAGAALLALLGTERTSFDGLSGRLLPEPPRALQQLATDLEQRPDLTAIKQREVAARLARRAGQRSTIPDITLGVGTKRVADERRADWELVLGVEIPLALFDRGQASIARTEAQSQVATGEYQLALREAQASAWGLWQKAELLQRTATSVQSRYLEESKDLAETARLAYRGGEIGILELLDAYRGVTDTELRALDLALQARLAMIELDRVVGAKQ
jgi:cobalt-zinc-cadmium efflux system outer membrane protein